MSEVYSSGICRGFFAIMKPILVDISTLKVHERISRSRLAAVRKSLVRDGMIRRPVIVERHARVILDGHHRVRVLQELGVLKVPVIFVSYFSPSVTVRLRRTALRMRCIKYAVLFAAGTGRVFPNKTTRHVVDGTYRMKPVPIRELGGDR